MGDGACARPCRRPGRRWADSADAEVPGAGKTIAAPARSAAAITSPSRMLPPGWITAVAPAWSAASSPSANGKKASRRPRCRRCRARPRRPRARDPRPPCAWQSRRCPAGSSARPDADRGAVPANTIAFDLTCAQTRRQAQVRDLGRGRAARSRLSAPDRRCSQHPAPAPGDRPRPSAEQLIRGRRQGAGQQQPQVRLGGQQSARVRLGVRRDHHLGEQPGDLLGGRRVQGAVERTMPP